MVETARYVLVTLILSLLLTTPAWSEPVKLAVFPSNDPAKLHRVMDIIARYLSETTGDQVSAIVTRDYKELTDRLRENSVDLAWINTLNYVRVKREIPAIRYLATYLERNEDTGTIMPYYQSYIIALRASNLNSLADAEGLRFAFTDKGSTSGYAYPAMLLASQGIDPDSYFSKVFFLKKHDRVIEALLSGSIDLGAVSDGTYFTAVRTRGELFTILATSEPIPLDAIVAAPHFSPDKMIRYQQALVAMPADHEFCSAMRAVLGWSAAGFSVLDDGFYDHVRQALKDDPR